MELKTYSISEALSDIKKEEVKFRENKIQSELSLYQEFTSREEKIDFLLEELRKEFKEIITENEKSRQ